MNFVPETDTRWTSETLPSYSMLLILQVTKLSELPGLNRMLSGRTPIKISDWSMFNANPVMRLTSATDNKFIGGVPMKPAENTVAGAL